MRRTCLRRLLGAIVLVALPASAFAIPALQLYVDAPGATYDSATQTWTTAGVSSFDLWVAGNTSQVGTISDVKLLAHYFDFDGVDTGNSIIITPMEAIESIYSGPGGIKYGSKKNPIEYPTGNGTEVLPLPSKSLAQHSEVKDLETYAPTSHEIFYLGDFASMFDRVFDFNETYDPNTSGWASGQINKYHVEVSGWDAVHFDAYDHYVAQNGFHYVKSPYSHDATGTGTDGGNPVPEPATLILLGTGLLGIGGIARRRSAGERKSKEDSFRT